MLNSSSLSKYIIHVFINSLQEGEKIIYLIIYKRDCSSLSYIIQEVNVDFHILILTILFNFKNNI